MDPNTDLLLTIVRINAGIFLVSIFVIKAAELNWHHDNYELYI